MQMHRRPSGEPQRAGSKMKCTSVEHSLEAQNGQGVNGGQDPRKVGGARFFGMTFADGLAAPCRRPLGGNQRPGGKRCQRRKPPEAGAEGPR